MNKTMTRLAGRPIVEPREGEKATLGIRVPPDFKRDLVAAAEKNGASLSEECLARLKFSLVYETTFGHRELFGFASNTLGAFRLAGQMGAQRLGRLDLLEGEAWFRNDACYDQGTRVAFVEFALKRPGGLDIEAFDRITAEARDYLVQLRRPEPATSDQGDWA